MCLYGACIFALVLLQVIIGRIHVLYRLCLMCESGTAMFCIRLADGFVMVVHRFDIGADMFLMLCAVVFIGRCRCS